MHFAGSYNFNFLAEGATGKLIFVFNFSILLEKQISQDSGTLMKTDF